MKSFCPLPHCYAVIQMDPVGMIRHYEDPIVLAAAEAMRPKKYLAYLTLPVDLPTPTYPWFRFKVSLIANTLRAEDAEQGITSDMVIPIYPNTYHPNTPREPIHTIPRFPFPICYHWIRNDVHVRIRRNTRPYDDSSAIKVSVVQHMAIDEGFWDDYDRLDALEDSKVDSADPPPACPPECSSRAASDNKPCSHTGSQQCPTQSVGSARHASTDGDDDSLPEGPGDSDDVGHLSRSSATSPADDTPQEGSIAELMKLGIFGFNVDDTVELMPLVDLWFELTDHLTAKTIPSPVEFFKEREAIMQIIHDARERAPSILPPFVDENVEIDYDAIGSQDIVGSEEFFQMEMDLIAKGEAARRAAAMEMNRQPKRETVYLPHHFVLPS
ncbi:hypothetical protein BD413DRAFT_307393 [Trametes elegans]|nr:hypothetical protein BD413DRAFT_307393 [Trametes elegans]